jgi:NAD(P)-dependent dehydrogenase (short-subunit alcohol dehydrogenase family)
MPSQKTAYVTGAASGIGRQVAEMLAARGIKVAIADQNLEGVKTVAAFTNNEHKQADLVTAYELDAGSWESQVSVFKQALEKLGGRIDYVYPIAGIGERVSIPNDPKAKDFVKPDLSVLDIDLNGFIYTASLAIQQMRRQPENDGFRGKSQ